MTDTDTRGRSGQDPQKQGRKEGIPLGRIAGIPVILAYSWFIIAAFTVIAFGPVLQSDYPRLGVTAFFVAFAYALLLLISVLAHELAHALTAKLFHWPTEKIVLNLWGGHTEFQSFTASPGRSVLVAMAGPAANFVLAGAGWLLLTGGDLTGVAGHPDEHLRLGQPADRHLQRPPGAAAGRRPARRIRRLEADRQPGKGHRGRRLGRPHHRDRPRGLVRGPAPAQRRRAGPVARCSSRSSSAASSGWGPAPRSSRPGCGAGCRAWKPAPSPSPRWASPNRPPWPTCWRWRRIPATGAAPAVVLYRPDGRPSAVVDAGALATVPAAATAATPLTAVSYALGAGAYVPEWSRGQELIQYLAQLEGLEYAVVDRDGTVTGSAPAIRRPGRPHGQGSRHRQADVRPKPVELPAGRVFPARISHRGSAPGTSRRPAGTIRGHTALQERGTFS